MDGGHATAVDAARRRAGHRWAFVKGRTVVQARGSPGGLGPATERPTSLRPHLHGRGSAASRAGRAVAPACESQVCDRHHADQGGGKGRLAEGAQALLCDPLPSRGQARRVPASPGWVAAEGRRRGPVEGPGLDAARRGRQALGGGAGPRPGASPSELGLQGRARRDDAWPPELGTRVVVQGLRRKGFGYPKK